jgi:hypothetical protein
VRGGVRDRTAAALLVALLIWPLAAFGGAHFLTAVSFGIACVAAAAVARPAIGARSCRTLDLALLALVAAVLIQLLPLPGVLLNSLSPHKRALEQAIALSPNAVGSFQALSVAPRGTAWAALVIAAAAAVFWLARDLFERGGVRQAVRAICATGMAISVLALAQAATAGRRIYWTFPTDHEGPLPFGPFINRNHFATWVIMAAPICFGYIAARTERHPGGAAPFVPTRVRIARSLDGRTVWLLGCGTAMLAALLVCLSRSGIVALAVASLAMFATTSKRSNSGGQQGILAGLAVAALAAVLLSDVAALADRLAAASAAIEGRVQIWRETLLVIRDFWIAGTGAGTYQTAMLLYQQSDRLWYFNQAHNHYLQIAAEGGVLLGIPAAAALVAYAGHAARRVAEDRSPMFWVRCGACCGLGAAALQSVWETGLTMPANAALAAVLAAVAVHEPRDP